MQILTTIKAVRAARANVGSLGLVPTMGFLHAGHMSLVARAQAECGAVGVSIFVNPTQFGPNEDLTRYPRDLPRDLAMLEAAGVDFAFTPDVTELYPAGFASRIEVGAVATVLEGAVRPGHFSGVSTVVAKLLNIFQPSRAYFGQKDAQQTVVIRRMVRDLDLPVDIVVAPTVREADGLALSSRNVYLTPEQRAVAPVLFQALSAAQGKVMAGERDAEVLRATIRGMVARESRFTLDYVSVADSENLEELSQLDRPALASLAARIGSVRLIDNVLLDAAA